MTQYTETFAELIVQFIRYTVTIIKKNYVINVIRIHLQKLGLFLEKKCDICAL